jgi:NTP pyrophosphatase (non-canonical NTP hydrolase)
MAKFTTTQSLTDFENFTQAVYGVLDDRIYSLWDLLVQLQRFTMRALKGIRKGDIEKLRYNLLIAFAWVPSNRLHVDIEKALWERFPGACSYCGKAPCSCKSMKPKARLNIAPDVSKKPESLEGFQKMFETIYPSNTRTLADAGVHLAEELGEVSEAIHNYLGQHKPEQFQEIESEMADYMSCIFGVANSAGINVAKELALMFYENCHVCHKAPCECTFESVAHFNS